MQIQNMGNCTAFLLSKCGLQTSALIASESLLEMQILRPTLGQLVQILPFNKIPR